MPTPQAREARALAIRAASRRVLQGVVQVLVVLIASVLAWTAITDYPGLIPGYRPEWTFYVKAAIFAIAALVAIWIVGRAIRTYAIPRTSPSVGSTLQLVFNIVAYTALIFGIFSFLGVNLSSALIGAGFLGIVLGLAAQTVLGNVIAAMAMHAARPFVVGDRITFVFSTYGLQWQTYPHEALPSGYTGTVREMTLIYTVVESDDGIPMQIPNGQMIQALVLNLSRAKSRRVRVLITVDSKVTPKVFLGKAKELLTNLPGGASAEARVVGSGATTFDVVVQATVPSSIDDELFRSEVLQRLLTISQAPATPEVTASPGKGIPPP